MKNMVKMIKKPFVLLLPLFLLSTSTGALHIKDNYFYPTDLSERVGKEVRRPTNFQKGWFDLFKEKASRLRATLVDLKECVSGARKERRGRNIRKITKHFDQIMPETDVRSFLMGYLGFAKTDGILKR